MFKCVLIDADSVTTSVITFKNKVRICISGIFDQLNSAEKSVTITYDQIFKETIVQFMVLFLA